MGAERLAPIAVINIMVTPLPWINAINMRVDAATKEEPQANLPWMLHCPYAFLPLEKFHDHCQLAPSDLQEWLQEQATIVARVPYEHLV